MLLDQAPVPARRCGIKDALVDGLNPIAPSVLLRPQADEQEAAVPIRAGRNIFGKLDLVGRDVAVRSALRL